MQHFDSHRAYFSSLAKTAAVGFAVPIIPAVLLTPAPIAIAVSAVIAATVGLGASNKEQRFINAIGQTLHAVGWAELARKRLERDMQTTHADPKNSTHNFKRLLERAAALDPFIMVLDDNKNPTPMPVLYNMTPERKRPLLLDSTGRVWEDINTPKGKTPIIKLRPTRVC